MIDDKYQKQVDEAVKNISNKILEDSFYLGSIRTETKAYHAIKDRLDEARPYIDQEFLSVFDALYSGVLADVSDAGTEVRRPL